MTPPQQSTRTHWLRRPATIRWLWLGFVALLLAVLLLGLVVEQHPLFGFEGGFGFYALYGFAVCVAMVVVAKVLGIFLKRREGYYDRPDTSPGAEPPPPPEPPR